MEKQSISLNKKRYIILISAILLTAIYWVLTLWHGPKTGYVKDLIVFHKIFGPISNYSQWLDLWQYIYQFAMSLVLFVFVPWLIVKFYLKENYKQLVFRYKYNKTAIIVCCIVYPIVIISTFFSAKDPVLGAEYPLSKLVSHSISVLILYEMAYFFYFFSYEAFYRGFLQFGLLSNKPTVKEIIIVVIIQTVITTLFHIGKPTSEIALAAAFGPIFGYVAIRFNSIWYGMLIHFIMNIFNDTNILNYLNMLPHKFFN